jgi:probable rRNA maturation factor
MPTPMSEPNIIVAVEAGDWPPKRKLQALAKRAVMAAVQAVSQEALRNPSPSPSPHPASPRLRRTGAGGEPQELSVVFSDDAWMRRLNKTFRGKDKPTNVLSFPQAGGASLGNQALLLGDVILAAETVAREAKLADKPLEDHMAHLIIHGFLHLLGYDHQGEAEAEKMEQLERVALETLGISDPYAPALKK